jgi:protein SCO1/2
MTGGMAAPTRRALLGAMIGGLAVPAVARAGRDESQGSDQNIDVSDSSPDLDFAMTRARDGKLVTAADYRGDVVLLYFGYTFCPDVCPLTLTNVAAVLTRLGPLADHVRVLFVTVDPNRDTLPVLKQYVSAFGPQFVGLRGTPDQLAALARRYRIAYSVTSSNGRYEVTHSSAIYAFDASGAARLLIPSLASSTPDIAGTAADLRRLIRKGAPQGFISHLLSLISGMV